MRNKLQFSVKKIISVKGLIFLIISLICLFQFLKYFHCNIDDKYILYRYAQHLANGYGFCFNIGEKIEGFTSLLYVLLLSIPIRIGNLVDNTEHTLIIITLLGRCISVIFTVITLFYIYIFLKRFLGFSLFTTSISLIMLVLNPDFIFSSCNGLETGLFIFLINAFIIHLLNLNPFSSMQQFTKCWVYGSLTLLCRADGFVFIGSILLSSFTVYYLTFKPSIKAFILFMFKMISPLFLTLALLFTFRYWQFSDFLPNTFYAKVHSLSESIVNIYGASNTLMKGWERIPFSFTWYVIPSLNFLLILTLFCIFLIVIYKINKLDNVNLFFFNRFSTINQFTSQIFWDINKVTSLLTLTIATMLLIMYTMYVGGDWMPGHRMIMHFYSLPFVLAVSITIELFFKMYSNVKYRASVITFTIGFLTVYFFITSITRIDLDLLYLTNRMYRNANDTSSFDNYSFYFLKDIRNPANFLTNRNFANALKLQLHKNDCIALYEIGCIPFQLGNDYKIIDISTLNDRFLSHEKSNEGYYSLCNAFFLDASNDIRGKKDNYIIKNNPRFIIFDSFTNIRDTTPQFLFHNRYKLVENIPFNSNNFFTVYKRTSD